MSAISIPPLDAAAARAARERIDQLTKPVGSLGRIEELAERLAAIHGGLPPVYERRAILVGAGDHGVTAEGVSAYPSEVTPQMVGAFLGGFAAINAFARVAKAEVFVANFGVAGDLAARTNDCSASRVGRGTRNFAREAAMDPPDVDRALQAGADAFETIVERVDPQLVALGEMGIGNTTSAAAMICAMTGAAPEDVVGRGTGVDEEGLRRKIAVVSGALARLRASDWRTVASEVGGFEIVGLAGALLAAAQRRIPILLDGFIVAAAALLAHGDRAGGARVLHRRAPLARARACGRAAPSRSCSVARSRSALGRGQRRRARDAALRGGGAHGARDEDVCGGRRLDRERTGPGLRLPARARRSVFVFFDPSDSFVGRARPTTTRSRSCRLSALSSARSPASARTASRCSRISQLAAAIAAWVLSIALSGAIHVDGFLDCCDGLFAMAPPERRLEIMRDPHHGTYAIVGMAMLSVLWLYALAQIPPPLMPAILALTGCVARGFTLVVLRPSRRIPSPVVLLISVVTIVPWIFGAFAKRRLGGVLNGDCYGAAIVVTEMAFR